MLRAPTLFEDAVKMLLTTNCSWEATRGMVVRLIDLAGEQGAFPTPAAIARIPPARLKSRVRVGYRAAALSRFARRVDSGKLDLAGWERPGASASDVREAILAEHGFGPYAAEGILRILGRHVFLAVDSWVRKRYRQLYRGPAKTVDRAIARRYARFGPYRGLALWLEITEATVPLNVVHDEIAKGLALNEAKERLPDVATRLDDELAGGKSLAEAASAVGEQPKSLPPIDATGKDADGKRPDALPAAPEFLKTAFETPAGEQSLLEETEAGSYFVLRVDEIMPPRLNGSTTERIMPHLVAPKA